MKNIVQLQNEILQQLKTFKKASPKQQDFIKHYIGGKSDTKLDYWGLKVPDVRSVIKQKQPLYLESFEIQFKVFENIWFKCPSFEEKSLSLYWLEKITDEQLLSIAKKLLKWPKVIDNWAHSDGFCSLLAKIYEIDPSIYHATFIKWNSHSNYWYRRISLLSLIYYARARTKAPSFNTVMQFLTPLMHDSEYYVQKAVGWTLRELYNLYPVKTLKFLNQNASKINPAAWYAATEKLTPSQKAEILKKRQLK